MQQRQLFIFRRTLLWLAVFSLCLAGPAALCAAAAVTVDVALSPLSFAQDEAARLTITISGTSREADISLPKIDNIRLQRQGTSTQLSVVNGDFSSSVSHTYLVQADKAGRYTIPSFPVTVKGETTRTRPIQFTVTQAGQVPQGYSTPDGKPAGDLAFLRISPVGSYYPGEIVPFTIKAYFTQAYRADINSLPTLHGDGVVMSQLQDKPRQTEESVNGRMYHVLTWNTSLSGIKAGSHTISFSLDAILHIPRKRRALSPFGNNFFDDSFFNDEAIDNFFGRAEQRPITAASPEETFTVKPLPTAGQPQDFSGAIGNFDLKVEATPVNAEIGEPITLTMEISGTGNFDRVEAPLFPKTADWKTYPPSSTFNQQGRAYSGTKVFEQAVVAKSAAAKAIPSLQFSYFDPVQKRYVTTTSKPLAVHIQQAQTAAAQPVPKAAPIAPPAPAGQTSTAGQPATPSGFGGLAPIHLETGSFHKHLDPLFAKSWFLILCAFFVLLPLVLVTLMLYRVKLEKHPEIGQQKHKRLLLEKDLERIKQARAAGDGRSFLFLSKTAIQNQLGLLWGIEPAALSLTDVKNRLGDQLQLLEIFRAADEAAYGGASLTDQRMQEYFAILQKELQELL